MNLGTPNFQYWTWISILKFKIYFNQYLKYQNSKPTLISGPEGHKDHSVASEESEKGVTTAGSSKQNREVEEEQEEEKEVFFEDDSDDR